MGKLLLHMKWWTQLFWNKDKHTIGIYVCKRFVWLCGLTEINWGVQCLVLCLPQFLRTVWLSQAQPGYWKTLALVLMLNFSLMCTDLAWKWLLWVKDEPVSGLFWDFSVCHYFLSLCGWVYPTCGWKTTFFILTLLLPSELTDWGKITLLIQSEAFS